MTNGEKYKTTEERTAAFREYCNGRKCTVCPNREHTDTRGCGFAWLELETPLTAAEVADTLAKYSTWRKGDRGQPSPCTWEEVNTAIERAVELLRNIKE